MGMAVSSINSLQSAYTNRVNYDERRNTLALSTGARHSEMAVPELTRYGTYERMGSISRRRNANSRNAETMGNIALTDENLQRIRTLYMQAQNAELTAGERLRIHEEIAGLIQNADNMSQYAYSVTYPVMGANSVAELNAAASRNQPSMDVAATSENTYRILNQYQTVMQLMTPANSERQVNILL